MVVPLTLSVAEDRDWSWLPPPSPKGGHLSPGQLGALGDPVSIGEHFSFCSVTGVDMCVAGRWIRLSTLLL